jgi:hypothetical protein
MSTTEPLTDEQLSLIVPILEHYQTTDPQDEAAREKLRTFLRSAAVVHPEPPTDAYLAYFLPNPIEGTEFIARYGANATGEDMREFVQDRRATQQ